MIPVAPPAASSAAARSAASARRPWLDLLVVAGACAIFLALTLYQLRLPGLYYDEAWDAVSTMQIVHGAPLELERGAHITLLGRDWPLMLDDYQGIISTYLLVPFFLIGGVNVTAIRAFPIVSGLIAVVLCYFLGRAWFDRRAGCLAALLFAISPSWVFWSRLGVYVVSEVVPITLGALLAFTVWWRAPRGRTGLLALGCFLMGLGLATKLLYVWPIGAVFACYILLHGRTLWQQRRQGLHSLRRAWAVESRESRVESDESSGARGAGLGYGGEDGPRTTDHNGPAATQHSALRTRHSVDVPWYAILGTLALGLAAFGLGAFTFLAYNWQTHGTWLKIRSSFVQTEYGANNTTVLPNLWEELDRFRVVLDGGYFWFQTPNALPHIDRLMPLAFGLAAVGLAAAVLWALPFGWPGARPAPRRLLIAGLAYAPALGLLLAAFGWPSSRNPALIVPALIAVLLAAGAGAVLVGAALRRPSAWARAAGLGLLAITLASLATWLLTGAPDGQARGPLDMRVTDLTGLLFWISLAELLALLGWSAPATRLQRPLVATLGFLAAVLAQSFPTLSGLWPTHLVVMLPLPQILIGAALSAGGGGVRNAERGTRNAETTNQRAEARIRWRGATWRPILAGGVLLALAGSSLWTDYRYHQDLTQSGGLYAFSDGIYALANYLGKAPDRPVVAAEWGIRRPVQILSQGRIMPEEIFQYGDNSDPAIIAAFDAALDQTLQEPTARYIFTAGTIGPYGRFSEFQRVLARRGLVPFLEHISYMRDGRPIYEVYTARPAPP